MVAILRDQANHDSRGNRCRVQLIRASLPVSFSSRFCVALHSIRERRDGVLVF